MRERNIDISQTLELRLGELLREGKCRNWKVENRQAIEDFNWRIEAHGTFSDGLRCF